MTQTDTPQISLTPLTWDLRDCHYAVCPITQKEYNIFHEEGKFWATWLGSPIEGTDTIAPLKAQAEELRRQLILPHITITAGDEPA